MENEKSKVQKRTFTAVEQACHEINGFREFYEQIEEKMVLSGQTRSTLSNYIRKLAHLSLKFGKLPQQIPEKDINGYLASLARGSKTPSLSIFKHTIYGLRYCYHMLGMNEKAIKLPSLKHDHKLPVVLNYQECIAIFKAPELLKHRVLLSLIYSAGLRVQEASHLKIGDLDFERMMIHIRQSKYKKDRYVPLSPLMLGGLHKYISACGPVEYVFNGHKVGTPMSIGGIQWVFREAVKKCNIQKRVTLHILPRRFVRIRHYGLLSTSHRGDLRQLQSELGIIVPVGKEKRNWKEICREHLKYDPDLCPHCGKGKMITIERLLPGRSPPFVSLKTDKVYLKID